MSRPSFMSAEQATKIALAWASGARYADACQSAGLTKAQARSLRSDPDWQAAYERARAEFVTRSLQSIDAHGERDWKATAWLLERILPERFGKRDTVQHEVRAKPLPWRSLLGDQVIEVQAEVSPAPPAPATGPDKVCEECGNDTVAEGQKYCMECLEKGAGSDQAPF